MTLKAAKTISAILGSIFLPFGIVWLYLLMGNLRSPTGDWLAMALGIAAGLVCIVFFPYRTWHRVLLGVIYMLAMFPALFLFASMLVCDRYHNCL
jgi:hypothetical protein